MNLLNIRNLNTVISYLLVVIVRGQVAANIRIYAIVDILYIP
jgi:hypothetical protein